MPIVAKTTDTSNPALPKEEAPKAQTLDQRIVRQGVLQAVLQSPALMAYATDLVEYKQMVFALAEECERYVWRPNATR